MHSKAAYVKVAAKSSSGRTESTCQVQEHDLLLPSLKRGSCLLRWKLQASVTQVTHIWMYPPIENSFFHPGPSLTEERPFWKYFTTWSPWWYTVNWTPSSLSQNPIFRGQTSWRSAKPAPHLVSASLVQRSSREATRSPFWSQSTLAALPHNFRSLHSHTFAMKIPASMMALICLNQPEFSSPQRKSLMEGDLSSHTAR